MARLQCPWCRHLPLQLRLLSSGVPVCGRCGIRLERPPRQWPLPLLGLALLAAGVLLARAPQPAGIGSGHRSPGRVLQLPPGELEPELLAAGGAAPALGRSQVEPLLAALERADRQWIPRAEVLPGGAIRYRYQRREGEPELSIEQIRALIAAPPRYDSERQAIAQLLASLERLGVRVSLVMPKRAGAAGEWDPRRRTLRVQPRVVEKGSLDFAKVLNHEAIHVAQSCRGGGVHHPPWPLGLPTALGPELERHLAEPVYRQISPAERQLEREAYAHQHNFSLGLSLLARFCQAAR